MFQMNKIDDERVKMTATFLNALAVAMVVAGAIAPLAAFTYGLPGSASGTVVAVGCVGWITAGVLIHAAALWSLGRMTQ